MIENAVVLLSGGLDSTAALCWAKQRYIDVRAFAVDYGQPNRDRELTAAKRAAGELGIPYVGIAVADALRPAQPMGIMAGEVAGTLGGLSRAIVPGRNVLLVTIAAAHACSWWPAAFDIVVGSCLEDQGTFPDCKPTTLAQLGYTLQMACIRSIMVKTPWADMTKYQILYALKPDTEAFEVVRRSWSCYRADGPCGTCTACDNRAAAFSALGVEDLSTAEPMIGGDPQREVA